MAGCTNRFKLFKLSTEPIAACDFYSAHCSRHRKIIYNFHDIKLSVYDCRWVLKHVPNAHNILRVIHNNRRQVIGLIYTKQLVSYTCCKHLKCDKVVPCKSALTRLT